MARKRKASKKDGPTAVAREAACTKALAHRLLQRGMTREKIIERIATDKRRKTELLNLPTVQIKRSCDEHSDFRRRQ